MISWLFLRLGQALLAAWGIASLVFLLGRLEAARPAAQVLDQLDALGRPTSPVGERATGQARRQRLGLSAPVFYVTRQAGRWQWHGQHNQYHTWLRQLLRGDLGRSFRDGQAVTTQLGPALAYTLPLMGLALLAASALALPLAVYLAGGAAAAPGRAATRALLTAGRALPLFVLGLIVLLLLANPDVINILPNDYSASYQLTPGSLRWLADYLPRLVLPVLTLVLASLPELTLPFAAMLRHELTTPYATAARAKGLSAKQVLWQHALPNAISPLVVAATELLPALVAGSVVVEALFALPGMGRLLADAAAAHDYPVLVAGVLLAAGARLLALLLADLLQYCLDPRLRATLA